MNSKSVPFKETAYLALGEAIVSAIVVAVFAIINQYDFTVLTGVALGSLVIILNFLFLSLSVNKAIDRALENAPKSVSERMNETLPKNSDSVDMPLETEENDGIVMGEDDEDNADENAADEATLFAQQYAASVQNSVKLSYIVRTITMLASLVVAFVLPGVFNVIATLVPLLMFRPILTIESLLRNKLKK